MHGAVHLPDMLAMFQFLIACMTHERRHRTVTRFLQGRRNLVGFDRGLIEELTVDHMHALTDGWMRPTLSDILKEGCAEERKKRAKIIELYPHAASIQIGRTITGTTNSSSGDVVFVQLHDGLEICEIWSHFAVDGGEPRSFVSLWETIDTSSRHTRRVRAREHCIDIRASQIAETCIYRRFDDGIVVVVVPPLMRA